MRLAQILQHEPQMQTDVGEHERFEQHVDRVPHVPFLQPRLVAGAQRSVADDEAGDDDRQHTRGVHFLGADERRERHHQPLHRLQAGVGQPPSDPQRHVAERGAHQRADDRAVAEQQERVLDEGVAARDLGHRDGEQRQRRGVVDEALAGQDRHHAFGQAEFAAHRDGGDGVGRRDDRAEHQRRAERQRHDHQPRRHQRHGERGDDDQADAEAEDRPDVAQERREREVQRRRVQQRRQHHRQQDVRVEFGRLEPRQERHGDADDDDDQRGFEPAPMRHGGDDDGSDDDEDEFHAPIVAESPVSR